MDKALAGIKILELCNFVSGPYCTKMMADLGAEVVKIEEPQGDEARMRRPFLNDEPHQERSALFLYLNTNKLSITLNLGTATGRKIFKDLVAEEDILVENNPPGVMESLGLDCETLKKINPRLIMTSITPFGQTGPYRNYKAYYLNTFHAGGEGYLLPPRPECMHREPLRGGGFLGEYESGVNAAVATIAAFYATEVTGQGQHIDVSKQESLAAINRWNLLRFANEGHVETRASQEFEYGGVIPCRDGYLLVRARDDHQWQGMVEVMGNPAWANEERFKRHATRAQHGEEVTRRLREWAADQPKEEVCREAQARRVTLGVFNTAEDVVKSAQMKARGFFARVAHPKAGDFDYPTAPYKLSETPWQVERPAPLLGEHNQEVYCRRLGYTKRDLVKLRAAGII